MRKLGKRDDEVLTVEDRVATIYAERVLKFLLPVGTIRVL